jgi:20S proteasome alpha/beta subunit
MSDDHVDRMKIQFLKGTTRLAFKFRHGVIVAVDSRETPGSFIGTIDNELKSICISRMKS